MAETAARPVPLALLMLEGPLELGDALLVVLQVARRASMLGELGLDYRLDHIRIDSLGGVRCSPIAAPKAAVPELGKLLLKLCTGWSDSPPALLGDLAIEGLVGRTRARQPPTLSELIRLVEHELLRFPEASLSHLTARATRLPRQLRAELARPDVGPSETAHWVLPTTRQINSDPTPGRADTSPLDRPGPTLAPFELPDIASTTQHRLPGSNTRAVDSEDATTFVIRLASERPPLPDVPRRPRLPPSSHPRRRHRGLPPIPDAPVQVDAELGRGTVLLGLGAAALVVLSLAALGTMYVLSGL